MLGLSLTLLREKKKIKKINPGSHTPYNAALVAVNITT